MKAERTLRRMVPLLALLVALVANATRVGASGDLLLRVGQIRSEAFPIVVAYVTVADDRGLPIEGLVSTDFDLFEEGEEIQDFQVVPVSASEEGISLILALDVSASMQGVPLEQAQAAAKTFLAGLGETDQVAFLTFATQVEQISDFTFDREALNEVISSASAEGWTVLNEAAYEAATLAGILPPGRKAIVVLTDGVDTESALVLDDAIEQAQGQNVPVYTIGMGTSAQADPLERLSYLTGGWYLEAPTPAELTDRFQMVSNQLRWQYMISYVSLLPADDQEHSLIVEATYKGETSRYERAFVAASVPVTIDLLDLEDRAAVTGVVEIKPRFTSAAEIEQVEYWVDGTLVATLTEKPFAHDWDASDLMPGEYGIRIAARDTAANEGETTLTLVVVPLVEVRITAPRDGAEIRGEVTIHVEARSHGALDRVDVLLDDEFLGSLELAPYEMPWDTSAVEPGHHRLTAIAYDIDGNRTEDSLMLTVPTPMMPTWILALWGGVLVVAVIVIWFAARWLRARRLESRGL